MSSEIEQLLEGLIADINDARTMLRVCTPSDNYYGEPNEWSEDRIYYIDADVLITSLNVRLAKMKSEQ
jgi:hypothetical protein